MSILIMDNYKFPPLDLLDDYADRQYEVTQEEIERNCGIIRKTLLEFKIRVQGITAVTGPSVTLYKVVFAAGVRKSALRYIEEDIVIEIGKRGVRVSTSADSMDIEIANDRPSVVPLKSLLNDNAFHNGNSTYALPITIGYGITGKTIVSDLAAAPNILVAGATMQGKSVMLHSMIISLLYARKPSELKFVLIDPKGKEFTEYAGLKNHYMSMFQEDSDCEPVISDLGQAGKTLASLCSELGKRNALISDAGCSDIKEYNVKVKSQDDGILPYIVVVIDEYADLVMTGHTKEAKALSRNVEESVIRLALMGRAAGIHLVIATRRPAVDVITGRIKVNFPTRIAFRTLSYVDSMTILGLPGAEKLVGKGDMLYCNGDEIERVQCPMVGKDEISRIADFIGRQPCGSGPYHLPAPKTSDNETDSRPVNLPIGPNELDEEFRYAAEIVTVSQYASTAMLQRILGLGYARAHRIMKQLELAGIVGPYKSTAPRKALVPDLQALEEILSSLGK